MLAVGRERMRDVIGVRGGGTLLGIVAVLFVCLTAFSITAKAQNPGNNAVYNSNNGVVGSAAFIDASVFASNANPNICAILNNILNGTLLVKQGGYPATGAVIDARGLNPGNTSMTCSISPWAGITNPPPSTILLPATTANAPIVIPTTWVLPNNTRLIGAGDALNYPASGGIVPSGTTLQACNTSVNHCSFSGSDMIDLGAMLCPLSGGIRICNSVSVENLTLDGLGQSLNGIVNTNAQTGSHVDHVSLFQIRGIGLLISAINSGPYSNLTFDTGSFAGLTSTVCAQILNAGGTRGIHGLTCISESNDATAAVLLDSSNNSIEDVRIVGFYDGILVGANANARSNVLVNIVGDTARSNIMPPVYVVHISKSNSVTDLSIMGANNVLGSPMGSEFTINDELTSTTLGDSYVAMYVLGKLASGGYSRFTTSPHAATWAVGTAAPNNSTGCSPGSLYSNTNPTPNSPALYVCSVATGAWQAVK
jgi:hypothetical protein